jgi:hypothetical protein
MEYTQGTWENKTMGGCEDGRQILCGKLHLATLHYGNGVDVNEATANARLMAAAPEILCILKRIVTYYSPGETRPEAIFKLEQAQEIIAKAEIR